MATKTVGVRLDADIQARLKAIAERQDRTPHYLMKKAVERFVEREEDEALELAIVRERIEKYERTGESISHEEMKEWMKGLAAGYKAKAS